MDAAIERLRWGLLRYWLLGGVISCLAPAARAQPAEHQVKAVFLFNFAQFVDWPPEAFPSSTAPLVVGIYGEDRFGQLLDEAVRDETAHGRPLVVRRFRRGQEIGPCQILFVGEREFDRWPALRARLGGRSVLTVGESEGFAEAGGMIELRNDGQRIRLRVNLAAARAARLRLSSKLLRAAEIVEPEEGP